MVESDEVVEDSMETINIMESIETIMATTISIKEETKARLDDYKMGNTTYDELLNYFMDEVDIDDVAKEHIEEHKRRMKDFRGVPMDEFFERRKAKK